MVYLDRGQCELCGKVSGFITLRHAGDQIRLQATGTISSGAHVCKLIDTLNMHRDTLGQPQWDGMSGIQIARYTSGMNEV